MDILLSYDVSDKQGEVKRTLKQLGYYSEFTFREVTIRLPNTTVWKKNTSDVDQAITDIQNIASSLGIQLERAIAVPFGSIWQAIRGYPHR